MPRVDPIRRAVLLLAVPVVLGVGAFRAGAHELPDNRLTVVQREPRHLSLTFYVDQAELMRRAMAPRSDARGFAIEHAAMPAEEFAARVRRARAQLEAGTRLTAPDGRSLGTLVWHWPEQARLQAALQQRAMRSIVAPDEHEHGATDEVRAELAAPVVIARARIAVSAEWQPLLIVWYRPQQVWLRPGSPPVELRY